MYELDLITAANWIAHWRKLSAAEKQQIIEADDLLLESDVDTFIKLHDAVVEAPLGNDKLWKLVYTFSPKTRKWLAWMDGRWWTADYGPLAAILPVAETMLAGVS